MENRSNHLCLRHHSCLSNRHFLNYRWISDPHHFYRSRCVSFDISNLTREKKHTIKKFKSERCQKLGNCFWIHTKTTEWSYVNRTSWVERLRTFIQHIDCIEHRCLPNRWNEVDDSFQSGCFYGFRCWWRKSSRWLRSWKINDKFRVIFHRWNNSTRNSSLAPQRSSDQDV